MKKKLERLKSLVSSLFFKKGEIRVGIESWRNRKEWGVFMIYNSSLRNIKENGMDHFRNLWEWNVVFRVYLYLKLGEGKESVNASMVKLSIWEIGSMQIC
jgi:hypothetical protein